jgi:hypothetical protein
MIEKLLEEVLGPTNFKLLGKSSLKASLETLEINEKSNIISITKNTKKKPNQNQGNYF